MLFEWDWKNPDEVLVDGVPYALSQLGAAVKWWRWLT